ncbi:MAG: hypothetical protein K6F93_05315 [Lachnospiraceae bacterium]|nr:hypothetical protein [Lachnospiraceae bacterium]
MIPDGRDFCDECEQKRANQADESYLDRLLSSVSSESGSEPEPRRQRVKIEKEEKKEEKKEELPSMADIIADVIAEENEGKDDGSNVIGGDEPNEIDNMISDLLSEMPEEDPVEEEPALDPDDIADIFSQQENSDEISAPEDDMFNVSDDLTNDEAPDVIPSDDLTNDEAPEVISSEDLTNDEIPELDSPIEEFDITDIEPNNESVDVSELENPIDEVDITDLPQNEDNIDLLSAEPSSEPAMGTDMVDPFGGEISQDESDEPEIEFVNPGEEPNESEVLGADELFALDDSVISAKDVVSIGNPDDELDILSEIESGALEEKIKSLDAPEKIEEAKPKKKKSLFQRLFGNVVEELTEEQKEERRKKAEEEEKQKIAILEAKKKSAEEAKAAKEAQKEIDKAEAEEKKKQADEAKRKAREEAREKARKKKEAREALEIEDEDEGKINKAGAGILFILFGVITMFIILGTNTYSYNLSIENAQTDFLIRHYNEAYYDVYGLTIKDEDIELYDRIMTVMYVNSQLNSYNYYMTSKNNDKALNSLIKGLEKYEKYYKLATTLGITDDLEYVKTNILNELNKTFKITEKEAYSMMNINDVVDYSEYIYALLGTYDLDAIKSMT